MEDMGHGNGAIQQMNLNDVSPATRLLEKRRQMFEVQEALEMQKEEFARREELFKRREDALRKQDLELQQQLIRFNKFLQENDSKTARAEKKAKEEKHLRELKEQEIQERVKELEELVNIALDKFDTDRNGYISLKEFVKMISNPPWDQLLPPNVQAKMHTSLMDQQTDTVDQRKVRDEIFRDAAVAAAAAPSPSSDTGVGCSGNNTSRNSLYPPPPSSPFAFFFNVVKATAKLRCSATL